MTKQVSDVCFPFHNRIMIATAIYVQAIMRYTEFANICILYQNCDMDTLAARMKLARRQRGLSQVALAKIVGCGQSTIASIENGRNHGSSLLIPIANALRVRPEWLASGSGEMQWQPAWAKSLSPEDIALGKLADANSAPAGEGTEEIHVWEHPSDLPPDENRVWIDRYDLACSAGSGVAQWEIRQKQAMPFTMEFFRSIGSKPQNCRLATTRGDSMEPYLFDRDMIMIDVTRRTVLDGKVYAICFEEEFFVKQLFKQTGGALTLHSYNPKYPDRIVPATEHTRFEILGQVIYRSGSGLPVN